MTRNRLYLIVAGVAAFGAGFWWIKRNQNKTGQPQAAAAAPAFSQAQEIQDFQIYSQLTQSQQAGDLSFVGSMLSLFNGGSSNGKSSGTTGGASGGSSGGGGGTTATNTQTSTATKAAAPPYGYSGSGVTGGTSLPTGYVGLHTGTAARAAQASGAQLYFQPAPGVFEPDTPTSHLAATTTLYVKK